MSNKSNENKQGVHGYKVFKQDWTCSINGNTKQYTCPGKFEEEGELSVCGHGMHFCQTAADCFNYYDFDSNNKVAEIIAYGEVKTDGDKSCTDKLEIVREIPWDELLRIVNVGNNNTGLGNTGDWNTGNSNTGDHNTGDHNTGFGNSGFYNSGKWNSGVRNTGHKNTGYRNTGHRNIGNWNTGDLNTGTSNAGYRDTGNWNTGDKNTGDWNTGNWNTGNANTGDWNTGNFNTGDWNKSSHNTGCFNTEEQKIMLFNQPSDMTYQDWLQSEARHLLNQIPKNVTEWINEEDMTEEEKTVQPTYRATGGYLKTLDESECGQLWWNNLDQEDKDIIWAIPNFDPDIFFECTGIKVE